MSIDLHRNGKTSFYINLVKMLHYYNILFHFNHDNLDDTKIPGVVGHDSQSVPGEIFARAHFHLIAEGQTSPRAEGDVEIV